MRARKAAWGFLIVVASASVRAEEYTVVPAESRVRIHVGKGGLFSFAGHEHEVDAPLEEGVIDVRAGDPSSSTVRVAFAAARLRVTGRGEPAQDVPKVQAKMLGPDVLDAARYPTIAFESRRVSAKPLEGGAFDATASGDLTLHGVTRNVTLPLRVLLHGDTLKAEGKVTLKQSDFGIQPISVAGVVKVKDELSVELSIVARRPARYEAAE
jgi:polyisoprenoid-binding protein YceI